MDFINLCLDYRIDKKQLITQFRTKYINIDNNVDNIINSLIKYPRYDKYNIDVQKYIEGCKFFINILYYNNREITMRDIVNFNTFKFNDIILCQDYKDIVYLFKVIVYANLLRFESCIKISYKISMFNNIDENIQFIEKKKLINQKYQLKIHSFNTDYFLVIFQCYIISAINMILQNKEFGDEIIKNEFPDTLTAENFYKGGNIYLINAFNKIYNEYQLGGNSEMIEVFQDCYNSSDGKCLRIIKQKLNMLTNNKYLFGLPPIKIYPHILVNDLLICLSPINFTNECKIIYNNNKYSFIYDLQLNQKYYYDILNKDLNEIILQPYNLYELIINDINFKKIISFPKHLYISTTLYDPNIYKMLFFTNNIYNNNTNLLINKFNIINTYQKILLLNKSKYLLNKFICFDTIKSHFYMIKFKNNKFIKYDSKVEKINEYIITNEELNNNIINNYKQNIIICNNNNIYDCIKYYKIVMLQYELI